MRIFLEWGQRLLASLRARRSDDDLEEELRLHMDLAAEEARRRGHPSTEADRAARLRVGGIPQAMEALRDQRGLPILSGTRQDLRLSLRALRATPLVTAVVIGSLALAIGANTAVFSLVNSLLLRALPVREPERLVHVTDSVLNDGGVTRVRAWSYPQWDQIHQRAELFDSTAAWSFVQFNRASGGEAQFVEGMWASGSYFDALGVRAVAGRTFSELDDQRRGGRDGPVAVISYGFWQRAFGADVTAIGRVVRLNSVPFTIVGVTPPEFFGTEVGRTFDVIVPLGTEPLVRGGDSVLESASTNFLTIIARLRSDQSVDSAAAGLRVAQTPIREATIGPEDHYDLAGYLTSPFTVVPAVTGYSNLRRSYEYPLLVVAVVVGLVLVIGCLNVANLLLARAAARNHELSVQVALGASQWRLARQLFSESLILSASGAALGVAVALIGSRFLVKQLSTSTDAVFLDVSPDGRVLAFTIATAGMTALLFGIAPALRAARARPIDALKEWGRTSTERTHDLMAWLVAGQVALSVVLVTTAGLFVQSFVSLSHRKLGIDPEPVLVVTMDAERADVDASGRVPLYQRIRETARRLPNVADASISFLSPMDGGGLTPRIVVRSNGRDVRAHGEVFGNLISPRWFSTFGTPLVAGRDFTDGDRNGAPRVAIVNEVFARRFFNSGSPLGQTMTLFPGMPMEMRMTIVGLVGDAVYTSPHEPVPPTWYVPIAQFDVPEFPFSVARLSVRANAGSPLLLTKSIERAVATVDPHVILTFLSLEDRLHGTLSRERLMAQLAGFFGIIALLLAALGMYGVTAYAVSRRRGEIGIRLALGAAPRGVIRLIVARTAFVVAAGIGAGAALSLWGSTLVAGLVYDLRPDDPFTLGGAAVLLATVGVVSSWVPARRAARIDPSHLLREN